MFAAPKVAIAAEQALLFWQMLQSRPLKPDVHCPEPAQPEEVAVLDSSVRFAGLAMGFPHAIAEQLPPLRKVEATHGIASQPYSAVHPAMMQLTPGLSDTRMRRSPARHSCCTCRPYRRGPVNRPVEALQDGDSSARLHHAPPRPLVWLEDVKQCRDGVEQKQERHRNTGNAAAARCRVHARCWLSQRSGKS